MTRWNGLLDALSARGIHRVVSAVQVHGADVVRHVGGWRGWLRVRGVDGHVSEEPGTALVVTVADCTPVFISHPRGVIAALHAGWRGTAGGILRVGLDAMSGLGCPADECHVHLGPAICGDCYEVGPEVFEATLGVRRARGLLDVRAILGEQATRQGVRHLTVSARCTRCDQARFFSHRGRDTGRQLGVIALEAHQTADSLIMSPAVQ
ncbi:MAG: polyphenol oxidase family protein [Gemmatimonadaceae bacterium]|nr:polyphenol oxidase family protein [Gemmatimonadaceae bacterium]